MINSKKKSFLKKIMEQKEWKGMEEDDKHNNLINNPGFAPMSSVNKIS